MQFDVTILGSNGAIPAYDRHPSAQIVNHNGRLFLIDCGEGTQLQMSKYNVRRGRLDHIFISHLHGDHFFGLIGLITSFNLNRREHALHIYGPPGLQEILNLQLHHTLIQLRFDIHFHPVFADAPMVIYDDRELTVETIILKHRLPTTGFLFKEKVGLRKIHGDAITQYNIPVEKIIDIKHGADLVLEGGEVIPNKEITTDPHEPRSYAYCSDTAYTLSFIEQIRGVNMIYHEATFLEEHKERAEETFHSTARQAGLIAKEAEAQTLLLGHFSARYESLEALLHQGKTVFENSFLAKEGECFSIER
jgi:ribonuclease Z